MIETDAALPPGALVGRARDALRETLGGSNCLWYQGQAGNFETDPKTGAVALWHPSTGGIEAVPTEPNEGNALVSEAGDLSGLHCRTGKHCGLVAPGAMGNAAHFSMAVIYLPPEEGEARTLLTVNTGYGGGDDKAANYLFLSDGGDMFTVKDTKGAIELTAPATASRGQPRLAIVTLSGDALAFQENRGPLTRVTGADPGMHAQADLFIGCRSHRRGLQKTLGGAIILDVLLWPEHTLLLPRGPEDIAQHAALQRYFLWEY